MRLIALTLLLANVALFAWFVTHPSGGSARSGSEHFVRLPSIPEIELITPVAPPVVLSPKADLDSVSALTGDEDQTTPLDELSWFDGWDDHDNWADAIDAFYRCYRLEVGVDERAAVELESALLEMGVWAAIQGEEKAVTSKYWVILPPLSSRSAAISRLRELQRQGVDSFVITDGENENGISLGVFSAQSSAGRLIDELRRKGIEPQLRPVTRSLLVSSVVFRSPDGEAFPPDPVRLFIEASGAEKNLSRIACEMVATTPINE